MQTINDKRMKRTKLMFHHALLLLLQEKTFEEISISDIVRKAEVNRGTFYYHYEQKEDLLEEMVNTVINNMVVAFRKPFKPYQKMDINEISIIPLFEHFLENRVFYTTMLSNRVPIHLDERLLQTMEKNYLHNLEFFFPLDEKDVNKELFYSYKVHGLIGFILNWIKNDFQYPITYMAEQLVNIVTINTKTVYIKC
ncbi:AcrR family transcriptional regulator [Bacillus sp. SLBN-46]|nr:AcrR family transcriptional regulator [Bacillus sp. SLBN-46]